MLYAPYNAMANPPSSPFPELTEAQALFKRLVWDPLWAAGNAAVETAIPVLKLPVLANLEEMTEEQLRDYWYSWLCQWINMGAIVLVNQAHAAAYEAASIQLEAIVAESGNTSPAYQEALANAEKDLSNFGHFYSAN